MYLQQHIYIKTNEDNDDDFESNNSKYRVHSCNMLSYYLSPSWSGKHMLTTKDCITMYGHNSYLLWGNHTLHWILHQNNLRKKYLKSSHDNTHRTTASVLSGNSASAANKFILGVELLASRNNNKASFKYTDTHKHISWIGIKITWSNNCWIMQSQSTTATVQHKELHSFPQLNVNCCSLI